MRRRLWLVIAAAILSGCQPEPTPPNERAAIQLFGRPLEEDRSLIKEFTLQINGVEVLNGHARTTRGQPVHYTGHMVKHRKLTHLGEQWLFMGHRLIQDGQTDWTAPPPSFNDEVLNPTYPGDDINLTKKESLRPGDYEVRFFLIITEDEDTILPKPYLIGKGRLTVEPGVDVAVVTDSEAM